MLLYICTVDLALCIAFLLLTHYSLRTWLSSFYILSITDSLFFVFSCIIFNSLCDPLFFVRLIYLFVCFLSFSYPLFFVHLIYLFVYSLFCASLFFVSNDLPLVAAVGDRKTRCPCGAMLTSLSNSTNYCSVCLSARCRVIAIIYWLGIRKLLRAHLACCCKWWG